MTSGSELIKGDIYSVMKVTEIQARHLGIQSRHLARTISRCSCEFSNSPRPHSINRFLPTDGDKDSRRKSLVVHLDHVTIGN